MKAVVFDIGGTLMEYKGMPYSWIDYYKTGFKSVNKKHQCNISESEIDRSVEILKSYNPRLNYREREYTPQYIFSHAIKEWNINFSIDEFIYSFFEELHLIPIIYKETIPAIINLKKKGYKIATLTDLPTGMPDEFFKRDIIDLLQYFDLYVSSLSCGYRKPNPYGLNHIAKELNIKTNELLYVGDEEKDRRTADNAGCKFIKIIRNEEEKNYTLSNLIKEL